MESNYGEILKNDSVMRNVVRSLATLAYADSRRAKFARTQLIAALKILQSGDIDGRPPDRLLGRRHGPHPVHPTSYQAYAVDFDGNGKRDIWNSVPDATRHGGQTCSPRMAGRRVATGATRSRCPKAASSRAARRACRNGKSLGVRRASGKHFRAVARTPS